VAINADNEIAVRRSLVGTWRLILTENTLKDGSKSHDYGPNGKGFLMYSADGYMCAVLMNPDRPRWQNPESPTQEEKASAFDGSYGYCGHYEINTTKSELIHLPEVSTGPSYLGTQQVRPYRFEGNQLVLSGGPVKEEPDVVAWRVVWEKVR
jgi:hypothetical protein